MSQEHVIEATPVHADDWATLLPDTEHARFFRSHDWFKTQLGPLNSWSLELRLYTLQAFADLRPVCIWWGSARIALYNDAYVLVAGGNHPRLLGTPFADVWPEIIDPIVPLFVQAERTRKAVNVPTMCLPVERNHFLEEAFFDGSFVPLLLQNGSVGGVYNSVQDVTRRKLADRRAEMLNLISTPTVQLTGTSVYTHIAHCLSTNKLDVPFALIYKLEVESEDGNHEFSLLDAVGVPKAVRFESQRLKLYDDTGPTPPLHTAQSQVVTVAFDKYYEDRAWKEVQWEGHGQAPQFVTTVPLSNGESLHGFLVIGNNPRRPADDYYRQFVADLQRHATSAVTATISVTEAIERNQRLQDQLVKSERQIRYMAQHSDIGMMQLALDGSLIWANERYYSTVTREDESSPRQTFIAEKQITEDDRAYARKVWHQVLQGQKVEAIELRLQKSYTPFNGTSIPTTILLSAFPYVEMGRVRSIMACMTEVSRLKWAESWQAKLAYDAKEAKRQQSEFTDAISHEIRNPLSAILQLADGIAQSISGLKEPTTQKCIAVLHENTEAARTILDCARHQKRIVDDVLTLSRMDFASISLVPVPTSPKTLVQDAINILAAEITVNAITLRTVQDLSLQRNNLRSIMCDSLRVTQILINLLSNAIKFTKDETHRTITVTYGITTTNPIQVFSPQIVWAAQRRKPQDSKLGPEWGKGMPLYLTFTVEDTGPGMTSEELGRVFDRFEQATPRTSIKYGGSGLGLFISHSLAEKQNGRIGAAAFPGTGSTFAFYVEVRHVEIAEEQLTNTIREEHIFKPPTVEVVGNMIESTPVLDTAAQILKSTAPCEFHLLLVEDNLINQRVLRKQLTKTGCTVYIANHGLEALEFLRTTSIWTENRGEGLHLDIILMDWEMPVMDGLTCVREIRSLERLGHFTKHPEVIAVTANVRQEQISVAREAGMDTVMPKPFVVSELLEMITSRLQSASGI